MLGYHIPTHHTFLAINRIYSKFRSGTLAQVWTSCPLDLCLLHCCARFLHGSIRCVLVMLIPVLTDRIHGNHGQKVCPQSTPGDAIVHSHCVSAAAQGLIQKIGAGGANEIIGHITRACWTAQLAFECKIRSPNTILGGSGGSSPRKFWKFAP